ncbi:hypothetical protein [Salmonella enterica]|nr:hypothetical protein [Salmonella enterica]
MMGTPKPTGKTKGAGTTFWLYTGSGDAFKNPLVMMTGCDCRY